MGGREEEGRGREGREEEDERGRERREKVERKRRKLLKHCVCLLRMWTLW